MDTIPVGKGYALWLVPAQPAFRRLAHEISRLSKEHSTPRFEPHVTLLSRSQLPEETALAKSASLAGMIRPTQIQLGDIGHLDEYFCCLFATVVPTNFIFQARKVACSVFGHRNSVFTPHMSLVYGKLPSKTSKIIAADLKSLSGQSFNVHTLALYRVTGAPRAWKCIGRFELK